MADPITIGAIASAWKLLGSLFEKYQGWSVRTQRSKEAKAKKARAETLMREINNAILLGSSSDDPEVSKLVREFRALIAEDVKPDGHETTERWVIRSQAREYTSVARKPTAPAKRAAAKKAAIGNAATLKMAAKNPATKKTVAKKL